MSEEVGALGTEENPMVLTTSNRNADSQIVLNDMLLLEQICKYPFLIKCQDADYISWGWNEVAKNFNVAYKDVPLITQFTAEELQWRWDLLKPFVPTLVKARGDVPELLWPLVVKLDKYLSSSSENNNPKTKCQQLILSQLPLLKKLSPLKRSQLEMEVLDIILQQELAVKATQSFGAKQQKTVEREYEEFLKTIRVKELPNNILTQIIPKVDPSNKMGLVITQVFSTSSKEEIPSTSKAKVKPEPIESPVRSQKPKESPASGSRSSSRKSTQKTASSPQFVPIKSAKYYIKPVRVRLKRLDLDDYISLAAMRRYSRHSQKD
ncbi:Lhr [Drosophila ananassae]|uniref:Lethal hybrid rescue protein n=1 Tax=Drosophila ananassae TaxID=7217 RepID=A0PKA1_DROAN|nr:uncharacterized protein LOC6495963 [Drosophila ananassae]EDV36763.1 Lhr [Drosophila ananassae]DAA05819.1 TPA_inf: lethal hybrid rescue protein [Drosophila ananassae]